MKVRAELRSIERIVLLLLFSICGFQSFGQTDTEFWFSVPEINRYHNDGDDLNHKNNGSPVFFRITAGDIESMVTITMPANNSFNGGNVYTVLVPANTTKTLDLFNLKFLGDAWGGVPGVADDASMENRLLWTKSDLTAAKPYINKNNKGVHITATAPITVYYEISAPYNMDLLTLKGRNALGKEFFIPFQTDYNIPLSRYNYRYRPYSSFDIVATTDNTHIRITPTHDVFVFQIGKCAANAPFDIWLNKGETAIIPPLDSDPANKSDYRTSNRKEDRLIGSKVEVVEGGDIAVITRDDMVEAPSGNVDFVGDQLVPTTMIGNDYAIVRGQLKDKEEHVYVVATQDATNVKVDGNSISALNAGMSASINISSLKPITDIHSDKPIYVYHLSGFSSSSKTQFAGALIPTITTCTGSTRVAFNRTKPDPYDFYLNILVRNGAETSFELKAQTAILAQIAANTVNKPSVSDIKKVNPVLVQNSLS